MTKKKILQLGLIGCLVLVLAAGGFWAYRKGHLSGKADVLNVAPLNLTAVLPSVADDVVQNHWAYQYIDAVTKYTVPATGEKMISLNQPDSQGSVKFMPDMLVDRTALAIYATRIANIPPCNTCSQSFTDVPSSYWAFGYIEAAYRANLFQCRALPGLNWCFITGKNYSPTVGGDPSNPLTGLAMTTVLKNAGKTYNYPNSTYNDNSPLTKALAAALIAYNLSLPGQNDVYPSVYLQWNFPSDPNAGFDLGYEIWRYDPVTADYSLVYTQDPPAEGMEEASDLGMFYDKTVMPGQTFTYKVLLMNRVGDYSAASQVSIKVP